jgi:hypothetical protein
MTTPGRNPTPRDAAKAVLTQLKQAEINLLDAVHPNQPNNALLLGAHAFLREAITALSKAI